VGSARQSSPRRRDKITSAIRRPTCPTFKEWVNRLCMRWVASTKVVYESDPVVRSGVS